MAIELIAGKKIELVGPTRVVPHEIVEVYSEPKDDVSGLKLFGRMRSLETGQEDYICNVLIHFIKDV
jgi:hypothetical protein